MVVRKNTEFDLIAGNIEEGGIELEDLTEDWMGKLVKARARDMYERKRGGQERDGKLRKRHK